MRRLIRGDEAPRAGQLEEQEARRPAAKGERPQPDRTEQECLSERKAGETLQGAPEREQSPKGAQSVGMVAPYMSYVSDYDVRS